jgi:hypothetical protein
MWCIINSTIKLKMEIQYNVQIEVTEKQYNLSINRLDGIVAFRKENNKFYIKPLLMKYKKHIQSILNSN